jgi:glycosyltransferase involved in cell wall biosynthesis
VKDLVSIVIPTRDRREFLAQAVASCLQQTYAELEIIIIDDASRDDTPAYLNSLQDPRIVHFRQDTPRGSVAALNRGFALARGAYLTWSSDDDLYAPEAVARMVATLEADAGVDFVYAPYAMIDRDGKVLHQARVEDPAGLDRDNYVGHCVLYRRKVYETVGDYHPEPFLAEEYEYWLRVRARFGMKRLDAGPLYYHRVHAAALTSMNSVDTMQDAVARARRPYIPAWKHHWYLGERFYQTRRRARALGHILVSLLARPWHRPSWRIVALLVLPPQAVSWIRARRA